MCAERESFSDSPPIRWEFKLEPEKVLKVGVYRMHDFGGSWEYFYANMTKDGRITIPLLSRGFLVREEERIVPLAGSLVQVRLQPASK
jgi:hypothetical protein